MSKSLRANKALHATATVLCRCVVAWKHSTVVAVASALPVAVHELGRGLLDVPIGLLINFNAVKLTAGVHRLILAGADAP